MNRRILTLLAAMMCLAYCLAQSKHYVLNIGQFTEFTVANNLNVNYKHNPDSAGMAVYDCDPAYASAITFSNNKSKIKIEVISDNPIQGTLPTITLYSATLSKVTNLGDSTVCLLTTNPCEKLGLKVMGNGFIKAFDVYVTKLSATVEAGSGHIFIAGQAQDAKYNIAGAGIIEAGSLKAQKVKAWMFGTGSIDCCPEKQLGVYGAGSGSIYYIGNPEVKKRDVGVKAIKIDQ